MIDKTEYDIDQEWAYKQNKICGDHLSCCSNDNIVNMINQQSPDDQNQQIVFSQNIVKLNRWMNQSERQFLITYNNFFILNLMSISREVKVEELRALTILVKDGEEWPQLDTENIESLD